MHPTLKRIVLFALTAFSSLLAGCFQTDHPVLGEAGDAAPFSESYACEDMNGKKVRTMIKDVRTGFWIFAKHRYMEDDGSITVAKKLAGNLYLMQTRKTNKSPYSYSYFSFGSTGNFEAKVPNLLEAKSSDLEQIAARFSVSMKSLPRDHSYNLGGSDGDIVKFLVEISASAPLMSVMECRAASKPPVAVEGASSSNEEAITVDKEKSLFAGGYSKWMMTQAWYAGKQPGDVEYAKVAVTFRESTQGNSSLLERATIYPEWDSDAGVKKFDSTLALKEHTETSATAENRRAFLSPDGNTLYYSRGMSFRRASAAKSSDGAWGGVWQINSANADGTYLSRSTQYKVKSMLLNISRSGNSYIVRIHESSKIGEISDWGGKHSLVALREGDHLKTLCIPFASDSDRRGEDLSGKILRVDPKDGLLYVYDSYRRYN